MGKRTTSRLTGPDPIAAYTPSIALRCIDGHLVRTADTVFAWYRLAPQRWSFRGDTLRTGLIEAIAAQYAELVGRWLHIRVTSRPYPIAAWAQAHVRNAAGRLPDLPGALSWDDYVIGEQRQLGARGMTDKEVYLGVEVRSLVDRLVETAAPLLRRFAPGALEAELIALDGEIQHVEQIVAGPGLAARPVTAQEMRWLLHRSCSLGLASRSAIPTPG